jgi:hypothetical protein
MPKKDDPLIPEYIPPPGGSAWRLANKKAAEESDLAGSKRRLRESRERLRSLRPERSGPGVDLGVKMQEALSPLGIDVESHFRKLLNLGVDLAEDRLRDAFGLKKKK